MRNHASVSLVHEPAVCSPEEKLFQVLWYSEIIAPPGFSWVFVTLGTSSSCRAVSALSPALAPAHTECWIQWGRGSLLPRNWCVEWQRTQQAPGWCFHISVWICVWGHSRETLAVGVPCLVQKRGLCAVGRLWCPENSGIVSCLEILSF